MPTDRSTTTVTRPGAEDVAVAAEVGQELAGRGKLRPVETPARRRGRARPGLAELALVLALLPILVAAVRTSRGDWVPLGDTAVVALRSGDVFGGGELPLLGTWSAKSWALEFHTHHPGPLFFDVVAVPGTLLPGPTGQVVGAALINALSVVGVFVLARRRGGESLALAALVVVSGLSWSMGSAVLAEPWNVSALLLPYLGYCLLAWSLAVRDRACLPWVVFLGSFLIQANLAFVPLVGGLALAVLAVAAREPRRLRSAWRRWRRMVLVAAGVGLACWIQPLVEQFTADDYGNMTRLARSATRHTPTVGVLDGVRMVARVVALPPWWARPSYTEAFGFTAFGNVLPSLVTSILGLVAVVSVLVLAARWGRAHGQRDMAALAVLAVVLLAVALATASVTPRNGAFGTTAYQLRWLWPVAAFVTFALLAVAVRTVSVRRAGTLRLGLVVPTGFFAALNVPATTYGTTAPAEVVPVAHDVVAQVGAADLEGPVLMACDEGLFDPYCEAVMVALQRRGIDFVMDNVIDLQQVGYGRRYDGHDAVARLTVTTGDMTVSPRPGARTVAAYEPLDEDEVFECLSLEEHFKQLARDDQLELTARGRAVAERGDLPSVDLSGPSPRIDPDLLVTRRTRLFGEHRRDLVAIVREDLLDLDPRTQALADRYVELQEHWDAHTVAVFLEPL